MSINVGGVDRLIRIIAGLALIAFALLSNHEYAPWGWVGIVPLLTGIIRWCPVYLPLGISTSNDTPAT